MHSSHHSNHTGVSNHTSDNGSIYTGSVLLMEAILRRRADVVDYLIANSSQLCLDLNSRDKTGSNILFYAASVGVVADLHKLIQAGCRVESDYEGRTVLMQAALSGRVDTARYLVLSSHDSGLKVCQKDSMGRNALFYGVESNSIEMVEFLCSAGIMCQPTEESTTVLMQSARAGNDVITSFLLERSGQLNMEDINMADFRGETALFYAVQSCSTSVVAMLIQNGADPLKVNADGVSAISFSMNVAPHCIVTTILENIFPVDTEPESDRKPEAADGFREEFSQECKDIEGLRAKENREEKIDHVDRETDVLSDEFPAGNAQGHSLPPDGKKLNLTTRHDNKASCCYDSDVSSRCSSSSGVCSRSTCSLYNSFNKSNCSNDELSGCGDETNNSNTVTCCNDGKLSNFPGTDEVPNSDDTTTPTAPATTTTTTGDTREVSDVAGSDHPCEVCPCKECTKQEEQEPEVVLKFSENIAPGHSNGPEVVNKNSLSNELKDGDRRAFVAGNRSETASHQSTGCRAPELNSNPEGHAEDKSSSSSSNPGRVKLLDRLLWSRDNRNRSLVQYVIEAGEAKLATFYLKVLRANEECTTKLRSDVDEAGCTLLMSACKQPLEDSNNNNNNNTKTKPRVNKSKRKSEAYNSINARLDLVKYLIEVVKIDPERVDKGNRNALFYAVESGSLPLTSYLLQKIKNVESDKTGRTILAIAVATGNQLIVSEILASKFAPTLLMERDEGGRTAFHFCAMQDCSVQSAVMLDTLLKYEEGLRKERHSFGSKLLHSDLTSSTDKQSLPDSVDFEGRTPLMYACQSGNRSAVMRLLRTPHVMPDRRDSKGRTSLHHCFSGSNASLFCTGSLLKRNVDVNATDEDGVSCLMLACQTCSVTNIPVIRMMVEFGADPVLQDREGMDSFDYCPPLNSHYVKAVLKDKTCMQASEREALWHMEQRLCGELHMNSVLRGLLKEGIFTKTLNFEVMKQTPPERVQKLIEILATRGRTAFRKFCKVLRQEGELDTAFELMRLAYVKETELFW